MEQPKVTTWVDVQKKTFTRWCNQFLSERQLGIKGELEEDLASGVLLCHLLEIISSKDIGRWNKRARGRYHFLENNGRCLSFIKDEGLKIVGIGPEDIVDKKLKLVLGLIWTLILRYQINMMGEGSPKWELLQWVIKQVEPYKLPMELKPLRNFTSNWQDGTVMSALVDSIKPGILGPTDMSHLTGDALGDCTKACETAEEEYGIPVLMSPEDQVNTPDELSMMTYVSAFRNYCSESAQRAREELERKKRTADPSCCYAYGPGLEGAETYANADFTIVAKNCFDEELSAGGDEFEVSISGPQGDVPCNVSDNGDGKYPATYSVEQPGDYTIDIKLRGEPIKDSPYTVHVNGPSAGFCTAEGPGVESARVKQDAPFKVTSFNENGEQVPTGGDNFQATVSNGPEDVGAVPLTDNGDGTYDGNYQVSAPGRYTVDVTLDGEPIKDSPFTVLVEGARAGESWADGPGLECGQTFKPGEFTIHAVDPDGNPCTEGGDPFKVQISGADNLEPEVTDNGDGTYTVNYDPTEPGEYEILTTLHDEPIKDSPHKVFVKPSPHAGKSWAEGPGLVELVDNEPGKFTIHAVDRDGNNREDGGDAFDVDINGPKGPVKPQVTDNNDGTYDVDFDPEHPGSYDINVTFEGEPIKDMPTKVNCKEGTDGDHSGFGVFSFTVQARDKRGENKTFGGDSFEVKIAGPGETEVETTDNDDGTYTAVYALVGEDGDTFRISASLNGKKIGSFNQDLAV